MTITIEVPEPLVKAAAEQGQSVEDYVRQQLQAATSAEVVARCRQESTRTATEAVARIRENRKRSTLGPDVTIRELIEEGRRYP